MAPKPKAGGKKKVSAAKSKARREMEVVAAAEAEVARQQAARVALRERASREAQYSRINSRLLDAEWLQRMRAAKLEELQQEAGELSRQHDAEVDRRDRQIESLLEDLGVENAQHEAAVAAHTEVLDSLLGLQHQRMAALHGQFEGDLRAMQQEFEGEMAEMAAMHHRQKKELADITAALQQSYTDMRAEAAATYKLMEEEMRSRASEGHNVMRLTLEGRIRELEGQAEAEHQSYVEATVEQEAAYKELAAKDAAAAEAIEQRTARLRQLQGTLAQWRGRIVANSNEWQRRNAALAREKEVVLGHHTALKGTLAKFRQAQEARLRQMSASYADVEAGLKDHLATAQRIMRVVQLCRKHELPGEAAGFGAASGAEETATRGHGQELAVEVGAAGGSGEGAHGSASRPSSCGSCVTVASSVGSSGTAPLCGGEEELGLAAGGSAGQRLLDAFMRRTGGALLDRAALAQERERLAAENDALRAAVAAVHAGSSMGAGTLDDPLNTLMVVNQRLQRELGGGSGGSMDGTAVARAGRRRGSGRNGCSYGIRAGLD